MIRQKSPLKTYTSIPWIIAFCALMSSIANLATGIVLLSLNKSGGDIALGVLITVFAVWGIVGSILALVFILKQNRHNRMQIDFMSQVAHELRTPLTSIRMYADTLKMRRFKDESEHDGLIDLMDSEITRLERLTAQVLESRQQRLPKWVDAIDAVEAFNAAMRPFINNPVSFERLNVDIADNIPHICVDRDDFINVVSNLTRNALTHGGNGPVYVSLSNDDGGCLLTVRDTGRGIPQEMRGKIFDPFVRGADTTDSGIPGFGLGLSIVSDFAKQYGAKLDVCNATEGGAIFTVRIGAG